MIVSLEKVSKYYGAELILKDVTAAIQDKDRIGLVGPNGEGKSTLLNMIAADLDYEEGEIILSSGATIGYLKQNSGLSNGRTIQEEMRSVFSDLLALGEEVEQLHQQMAQHHDDPAVLEELTALYAKKQSLFEQREGYSIDVKINMILSGMGFANYDRNTITDNLSGGEKTRLAIAQLLLREPNLLILDEPTNHLDFKTLGWLEEYLSTYKGALLVVSHDRYFLDHLVGKIWEVERTVLTEYNGNYSSYVKQKKERVERQLKEYELQQAQIAHMEDYIARNLVRATTSKMAKSRRTQLEHIERIEKPQLWSKKASFTFDYDEEPVKDVLHAEDMAVSVGLADNRRTLFQNLNIDVLRGEKIAFIGPNGVGKSSLLKALMGKIPAEYKRLDWGRKVQISYYDQENKQLSPEKKAIDEIWDRFPDMVETDVRNILGRVLLSGEDVYKDVGQLSGGERAKVAFAVMMLERGNVLIMDEPTNHLDIASKEMLEDALASFTGTLIMVSHDRYLLNKIPTKIIEMYPNGIEIYNGRYDYYLEHRREPSEEKPVVKSDASKENAQKYHRSKQERAHQVAVQKRIALLEKMTEENEAKIEELSAQMAQPEIAADYQQVEEICRQIEELKQQNEAYSEEWLELCEEAN
ncbi:MAG: ABC-F family ATP-binding cassette domain-containing protein [Oscillospiraceae bacterium]|nr:ABC-F family ATP-binding cassette domain-containing protein [Oscillospiraceae bacterium]